MTLLDDTTAPPTDPPLDPVAAALHAAVDALLASSPAELSPEVALERQRTVLVEAERIVFAALRGLRDIDVRELYAFDGAGSASGWMRSRPVAPVGVSVSAARQLEAFPHAAAEVAAGRLAVRDAATVAAAVVKVPAEVEEEAAVVAVLADGIGRQLAEVRGGITPAARAVRAELAGLAGAPLPAARRLEEGFVTYAQQTATALPPGRLRGQLQVFLDALDPEGHDRRDAELHEQRHLDLQPVLDGGWHVRGLLDAETGELLSHALARFTPTARPDDELRTTGQVRHDALRDLVEFTVAHPRSPKPVGAPREIVVVAPQDALDRAPGALPARFGSGARLAPATLERLGCGALFTAVLLDGAGRPLRVGRTKRLHTQAQRTALHVQWGGLCGEEGCGNPGTIPHHITPRVDGGHTDLHDTVPVCKTTHHHVHTGRKHIKLKDGRWIGPHGQVDGPSP